MSISANLIEVRARIERVCKKVGRSADEIALIAVSKLKDNSAIEEAYRAGLRDFAENYVQALEARKRSFSNYTDMRWHLIGHLQTNKAKQAVAMTDVFHALDSKRLADALANHCASQRKSEPLPVFVQVNIDYEPQKTGLSVEETPAFFEDLIRNYPSFEVLGLMCVPSAEVDEAKTRMSFARLRSLRDQISEKLADLGAPRKILLNMGMSADFEIAVEEGADWIRLGTILFGQRRASNLK